jgi:hypothetical protein
MAAFIQSGLRLCGNTGYFTATDTDWNLIGSTGLRVWAKNITFLTAFGSTPSVNPFLAGFSILQGSPHKIHVGVASVTTTGFQLQVTTWDDCQIVGVSVGWIAFTN